MKKDIVSSEVTVVISIGKAKDIFECSSGTLYNKLYYK